MKIWPLIILLIGIAAVLGFFLKRNEKTNTPAQVKQHDESREALPIGKGFSQENIKSLFALAKDEPFNNKELGYKILIPKNWEVDTVKSATGKIDSASFKAIAHFVNSENTDMHIYAMELSKEISAAHLLRYYATMEKRTITNFKEISIYFADSLMSFSVNNKQFLARVALRINGNTAFIIFSATDKDNYESLAETFGLFVSSFNLTSPSNKEFIEERKNIAFLNGINFNYPDSLVENKPEKIPEGMQAGDLYHFDKNKVLKGMIRIKIIEKNILNNVEVILKNTTEEFAEANVKVQTQVYHANVESTSSKFTAGQLFIYDCMIENNKNELWVTLFSNSTSHIIISLLTPARDIEFYDWSINKRAYEIILESTK